MPLDPRAVPIILEARAQGWGRPRILRALRERGFAVSDKALRLFLERLGSGGG